MLVPVVSISVTGRPVSASEALSIGLANRVVPKGQAVTAAQELAAQIADLYAAVITTHHVPPYPLTRANAFVWSFQPTAVHEAGPHVSV